MRKWFIIMAMLSAVALLVCRALFPREPTFQGRTVSDWALQYQTNRWPSDAEAVAAIRRVGTNALPVFLKLLASHEYGPRVSLSKHVPKSWFSKLHIDDIAQYKKRIDERRQLGAHGLVALGTDAQPAIPAMLDLLHDREAHVRCYAVFAFRALGPVASNALPAMIICLNDPEVTVQDEAVSALGTIHQQPETVVPIITEFLEKHSDDMTLANEAMWALGRFGTEARKAIPIIETFTFHEDPAIRSAATNALMFISPKNPPR